MTSMKCVEIDMYESVVCQHAPEERALSTGLNADEDDHLHGVIYLKG